MIIRLRDLLLRIRQIWILVAGLVFIFFVLLSVAFLTTTSTSGYCLGCHEMRADIEAWKTSTHAQVSCVACHRNPGLGHFLIARFYLPLKEDLQHFLKKYPDLINADGRVAREIPAENCRSCHNVEKRKITPSEGIIIDHKKHTEKKISCTVCHNRVAHPSLVSYLQIPPKLQKEPMFDASARVTATKLEGGSSRKEYFADNTRMVACTRCHNGKTASDKCETCHTPGFKLKPDDHTIDDWMPKTHLELAKEDTQYCASCHKASFCYGCHKTEMPHSKDNWVKGKKQHGLEAQANPSACRSCHSSTLFCDTCHHKDWDPSKATLIAYHQNIVKDKGTKFCFTCHNPVSCASCHVKRIRS